MDIYIKYQGSAKVEFENLQKKLAIIREREENLHLQD